MNRSKLARVKPQPVRTKSFALKGGLNLVDAPLTLPEGVCIAAINYELLYNDGYRRCDGHERHDGQGKPSEASYWILNYDGGTVAISEGDVVTGLTSGATGKNLVNQVGTVSAGYLVLTDVTNGPFQDDEALQVSAATRAFANGVENERGASTPALDSTYLQDAIETRRALIGKVGAGDGSGPVRGVHVYKGDTYAFRDNSGATAGLMWKATTSGWVQQSLGNRVAFTAGTAAFLEGETLTQTGTTSTINRIVVQSGDWSTNDAAGYLVIGAVTSGPYASGIATSASGSATLSGAETANALAAGGRYEFRNGNFFGSSETQRMYGVNGVSEAFEWDGSTFVPILTGNTTDTPTHLEILHFHLMLVFQNGSLQNSSTGTPYVWSGGGAAEIGVGHNIVGLQREVGGVMIVLCRNKTFALFGRNTVDLPWDLQTLADESGGIEWTMNRLGRTRYLDDGGFYNVRAVQAFGSFDTTSFSKVIQPLVDANKDLAISSIIVRKKSQVRTFFSDGSVIVATFKGDKLSGFTNFALRDGNGDPLAVRCTANGEDTSGNEILFLGGDDGYVYQMDSGTSFDGNAVSATLALVYDHLGYPSYDKQMKKVVIETDGAAGAVIDYAAQFDYSSGREPAGLTKSVTLIAGKALWNDVFWNTFIWSDVEVTQIEGDLDGSARNVALQIFSTGTYVEPHTLYSVTYHYILRKLVR